MLLLLTRSHVACVFNHIQNQKNIPNPTHHEDNRAANELQEMFNFQASHDYLTVVEYRSYNVRLLMEILERKQCKSKRGRPGARTANANDESASLARKLGDCENMPEHCVRSRPAATRTRIPIEVAVTSVYGYNEKAGRRFMRTPRSAASAAQVTGCCFGSHGGLGHSQCNVYHCMAFGQYDGHRGS